MDKEHHQLFDPGWTNDFPKNPKPPKREDGNLVQKSNKYSKAMLGHDGRSVSKPVDAQLFNVDLSSVPLPPASATAVTTIDDSPASTSRSSHQQSHTNHIPRTMNDHNTPSGSTVSSIVLPSNPAPLPIATTTTTTTMHLPFPSSNNLSINGSGMAQSTSTVPQPVPPPLPLSLTPVSTVPPLPPTPVPPVPPPPVMPVPQPVGLLSLPASSIGSYTNIAQCSTIQTNNIDRNSSSTDDKKEAPESPLKVLSTSLDSRKVANTETCNQAGKKTGGIIHFSLKSPDGGGKPKVSFQIKRKNRPIVGDKSESIGEDEDVVNSNPGQFVTRKREMFNPAEMESVSPQQLAFIKKLEVLENVQKKTQTSPTASESSSITAEFQAVPIPKLSEKLCEKMTSPTVNKVGDKYSESSVWEKVEKPVCDKPPEEAVLNEKAALDKDKTNEEQPTPDPVQEQLNYATEKSSDNLTPENSNDFMQHKEKSSDIKPATEKVPNTPEKCYDTSSSLDRLKNKSTRDRSREHSGTDRSYERSSRDRAYDKSSDKGRDKSTRERSGRESSHDRSTRGSSYERSVVRDKSVERSRDWDRSRDRSTQDRSYDRSTHDRSHERSNRDRYSHDRFRSNRDRDRSNRDRSRERSTRERSRDRSTRDRSRDRYGREKSYERSSRERSNERCTSDKGSERLSCERSKSRLEGVYDYRSNQRRSNTWDRRSRWTDRHDERSSYEKYDDGRYGRSSDKYKRDMYESRMSTSHYYDDEHYGRSHYDDRRSRHDEKSFHSQDSRHPRSDDSYSDHYDKRNRRSIHSSEERLDMDSCPKSSEDTTSPHNQQYLGGSKASNMSSGISAISAHYSQASDSDGSPSRNLEGNKSFDHLSFNASTSGTNSTNATNKQLAIFAQANQSQNYNKIDQCQQDTYNYGDSTPVRDEPNDYEINFSQNAAPVNSYSGFSQLYQPTSNNVSWLNTGLEPPQSIQVGQRLPVSTNIPTVHEESTNYSTSAVLSDVQPQVEPAANLLSISPASINNSTQINIGNANTNFEEHTRIPAVLEDFPKVSHSNGLSQGFGTPLNICPPNVPPIVSVSQSLSSNVVQKVPFPESISISPTPVVNQLVPAIASDPEHIKSSNASNSKTALVSPIKFRSPQKNLVQPHVAFSTSTVDTKKKSIPVQVVPDFWKGAFNTSDEEHKVLSQNSPTKLSPLVSTCEYSVTEKVTLSQPPSQQTQVVDSSQNQILKKTDDVKSNSSSSKIVPSFKPIGSTTADNAKYFPLHNNNNNEDNNTVKTKTCEESQSSKPVDVFISDVLPTSLSSSSSSSTSTIASVVDIKQEPIKDSISVNVVVENVSMLESQFQDVSGKLCSSIQILSSNTNEKASQLDVDDEVSSSECLLSKTQLSATVLSLSSSLNNTDTQHQTSEISSLAIAPKEAETSVIKNQDDNNTKENLQCGNVSTVGLKDNFDEEFMEVDSPASSGNIETENYFESHMTTMTSNKESFAKAENTDCNQEKSLIFTDKLQPVASSNASSFSVDTSGNNFHSRLEKQDFPKSNLPSSFSSKEQEISSSGIHRTNLSEIKDSEDLVTTTDYRLKKLDYSSDISTKFTHQIEVSGKLQDLSVTSDFNKVVSQSNLLSIGSNISAENSQSSMVTSSDEKLVKAESKSQFHAVETDNVLVIREPTKEMPIKQAEKDNDNSSSSNNNKESVSQVVGEVRLRRDGRRRPRTRWDNVEPTPILHALESELTMCSSQKLSTQNQDAYQVGKKAELKDNLQISIHHVSNSNKLIGTSCNLPSTSNFVSSQRDFSPNKDSLVLKAQLATEEKPNDFNKNSAIQPSVNNDRIEENKSTTSEQICSAVTENAESKQQEAELEITSSNDSDISNSTNEMGKTSAGFKSSTEDTCSLVDRLEMKSKPEEMMSENDHVQETLSDRLKEVEYAAERDDVRPLQAKSDDTLELNSKEDRDSVVSSKPTSPETSIKDEDGCKDDDTESVSSQKSFKGTKKMDTNTPRVSSGIPAPRRSGRIRSLEEKRVREKEEKKEKDVKMKKEKKQELKVVEVEEKCVSDEATSNDAALVMTKDEISLRENEEKKERESRRTRTRFSTKDEEEEADRKKRDTGSKASAKEDKKVNDGTKEKPKRLTRNKKQMEADRLRANESKMEMEAKLTEGESPSQKSGELHHLLGGGADMSSASVTMVNQCVSSFQMKRTNLANNCPGVGQSQNLVPIQKETSLAAPALPDPSTPREPKKEDPLLSARPLKVKSRWRRTMEAEWLSASASISSGTSSTSTVTSVATSNTPSPQLSPSTVALSSSSAASTLQPFSTSSSSVSSYPPQMSDNLPVSSQANSYPTQQQQMPRASSPQLQPSIQISSSSQLSPQQKPQPVVSSTFQSPEDLPIIAKTISTIVNEDPRKSYLQKPAFETILEEDEDKKKDAGDSDVTRDTLSASSSSSLKEMHVRSDSEADKENTGCYEEIVDNIYLTERKRSKQMREVRRMVCDCTTSHEDREQGIEACGEDCLNRMLMIECGSRCPCIEFCNNKRFTRHQYVNVATFKTESKGLGLMSLEDLQPHTFVMEYVGEVLDYREFKNRTKQYAKNGQEHYYFMSLNADEVIDATYRGNKSRFINHSCDPNCETQKWTVNGMLRIGFFTKKNIKAGTEMTFDYQFESKQAQKCYCGAECCRGTIGGKKKTSAKSKKKVAVTDKRKKEFEDESNVLKLNKQWNNMSQSDDDQSDDDGDNDNEDNNDEEEEEEEDDDEQAAVKQRPHDGQIKLLMLEEEMERMSQLDGLKNKEHVLNLCRLMVRAESNDHRLSILRILQGTNEQACLRLFLDYHGLPLLWSWMADIVGKGALYLKSQILSTLKLLPITNKTILQESKILPMVVRWANELKMTSEHEVEMEQINDNSSQAGTPSSVTSRDDRPPKKKVKFADETSSDSEMSECSRLSGMIYLNEPMAKNGLNEAADSSDIPYTEYSNQTGLYMDELDESRTGKVVPAKSGILIKAELQKELSSESSSSPGVEDKVQSNEAESSSSLDILDKCSSKEKTADNEILSKDDDNSNEVKVATDDKNFDSNNLSSVVSLATDLLKHWSDLKEVFKIPKKEKVEERKRTERELERDRMDRKRRYEVSPDKGHSRFRSRSDRRREEVQELLNPNRPRRVLLPTPPKLSKEERRQQFEAQVRAQDEMAEYQKQQEAAYIQQQQQEYMQHQYMGGEMAGYDYYVQQDPNIAYQQDPNMAYQQDPNIAYQQDPNAAVAFQADPNSAMYQDPNAQYQDPSVYHGYHLPPPTADPNAYPIPTTDPSGYPIPQTDVNTAYQIQSTESTAYQMHPPDPNAYAIQTADPNAYPVNPADPNTYQPTSTDQAAYIQADSSFQIPIPPTSTNSVGPAETSYPSNTPTAPGSSPVVAQKPQASSEGMLEHCYIAGQTAATVPPDATSQTTSNLNAISTMTPTYIDSGSSTPAIYPNAPATVYQVQSKFMTAPQATVVAAAAAAYSQANPSVPPPQGQSASVPQLPPPTSQLQSPSGLASLPTSAQQNASLTPVYVQQQQQQQQQQSQQTSAPQAPQSAAQQAPPPAPAPAQVYYPTAPQAMVVPASQHHYTQPQATTPAVPGSQVVQIDQSLLALQQVKQLQQQLQIQNIVLSSTTQSGASANSLTEDEPPPPPSPPKPKVTKLPPNWKMAKDSEGKNYYYHTVTRQTQWDLPVWEQGEQDDMDLGTPTHDEPQNKSKKKATTAAADTSSELAKRSKEAFRNKMSQWIVSCLNPYRKPDCRLGRISSTDDFKHLARKLTHHVMAKELKHCKHPEDLEVNENVKAKAKDYIKKYMSKFGANYKKAQSPTPDD